MRELSGLKELIAKLDATSKSLDDAKTALELEMMDELRQKLAEVETSIHQLEDATYLSGHYDQRIVYYLSIPAQAAPKPWIGLQCYCECINDFVISEAENGNL